MTTRMDKNAKLLTPIKGKNIDIVSKPLPPGTLYVLCLNKPLINLWAMNDSYSNDHYDTSSPYSSSIYKNSETASQSEDRIPVMLSPEEEMLLYNDGLTDLY
jgi:hypothetical protein